MTIQWLFVRFKNQTWKLWRFEVARGFDAQQLRENVYLGPTLGRKTKNFLTLQKGCRQNP